MKTYLPTLVVVLAACAITYSLSKPEPPPPPPPVPPPKPVVKKPVLEPTKATPEFDWEKFWLNARATLAIAKEAAASKPQRKPAVKVKELPKPSGPTLAEIKAQKEKQRKQRIEREFYAAFTQASQALSREATGRTAIERLPDVFKEIEYDFFAKLYSSFHGKPVSRKTPDTPFRPHAPDSSSIRHGVNYCVQQARGQVNIRTRRLTYIDRGTLPYQQSQWMQEALKEELEYYAKKLSGKWVEEIATTYDVHLPKQ